MPEKDDQIKLRVSDAEAGLREWVKQELKNAATYELELGKFFFGVSAGTLGAIVAIVKLAEPSTLTGLLIGAIVCFLLSIVVTLFMVMPFSVTKLSGETVLDQAHRKRIWAAQCFTVGWFLLWGGGTVLGLFAILLPR